MTFGAETADKRGMGSPSTLPNEVVADVSLAEPPSPMLHDADHDHEHDHATSWQEWARVAFVGVLLLLTWLQVAPRFHGLDLVALTGIVFGGYPIFREAITDLLKGQMTMELSMTIALAAASAIGEFMTALVITLFVLVAEILEGMTVGRGRRAALHDGKALQRRTGHYGQRGHRGAVQDLRRRR